MNSLNQQNDGICRNCRLRHKSRKRIFGTGEYFPNHLIHGLLALHCADETGCEAGNSTVKDGQKVIISEDNTTFKAFIATAKVNIDDYLASWRVLKVIEDAETGYLGVIYVNNTCRQLVLSHRSTNFALSLKTRNILSQSGLQQDIEGVLMGDILKHQTHGYKATQIAIKLVQTTHMHYSLSFSGHSLGAWLASLSVFYSHDSFKYNNVQAIVFDGPGCREMIQKLGRNNVLLRETNLPDLNIVSYLSPPNIVNCANRHVGKLFTLFPDHIRLSETIERTGRRKIIDFISTLAIQNIPGSVLSLFGHDLKHMLPYFDPNTGLPKYCKQVEKWPSISYENFGKGSDEFTISGKFAGLVGCLWPNIAKSTIGIVGDIALKTIEFQSTTLSSIARLAAIYYQKKIDMEQFWLVHKYLDETKGFIGNPDSKLDQFMLKYEAQYSVDEVDTSVNPVTRDKIHAIMLQLQTNASKLQGSILRRITDQFKYDSGKKEFAVREPYKDFVTLDDICNQIRDCKRNPDFEVFVGMLHMTRLPENIQISKWGPQNIPTDDIYEMCENYKIGIVKGMPGRGKTTAVKIYAKQYEREFTSRVLECTSQSALHEALKECRKLLYLEDYNDDGYISMQYVKDHLVTTKQQVLFILDDVKDFAHISKLLKEFDTVSNVRFIITTQNDRLCNCQKFPEIVCGYVPLENGTLQNRIETVIDEIIGPDSLEENVAKVVFKALCFLKPGKMTQVELADCYPEAYSECLAILHQLSSISLVTTDDKNKIHLSSLVQSIALKYFGSISTKMEFLSTFKPESLMTQSLYEQISPDLDQGLVEIKKLPAKLNIEQLCNMETVLTVLAGHAQTCNMQNKHLVELGNHFAEACDKKLESLFKRLCNGWTSQSGNANQSNFLENNSIKIQQLLMTFKNFTERLTHEDIMSSVINELSLLKRKATIEHVLVIGATGSGKTTVIDHLIGNHLDCKRVGRDGAETEIIAIQNGDSHVGIIGNTLISETSSIHPYFSPDGNTLYWDFPGFFDNRGEAQKIHLAFLMNSFCKAVPNFKILLVTEASMIYAARGKSFMSLLNTVSQLCQADQIQNSISLLLTKCDSFKSGLERNDAKIGVVKTFSKYWREHGDSCYTDILGVLSSSKMINRIAYFPKVEETGIITRPYYFEDWDTAIAASYSANIIFNLSIDHETYVIMSTITDLMDNYALHICKGVVRERRNGIKVALQSETFRKEDLSKYGKFSVSSQNGERLLAEFDMGVGDNGKLATMASILEGISFLRKLNSNKSPNLSRWVLPFTEFDTMYDQLVKDATADTTLPTIMQIQAVILCASEIQKLYDAPRPNIDEIQCRSYLFIVDQDLNIPGINLSISGKVWRIFYDRKISLQGSHSNGLLNSGSFYGCAEIVSGGRLSFALDGVKGDDGVFSLSLVEKKIAEKESEIKCLSQKMKGVETIMKLQEEGLNKSLERLQNKQRNCQGKIDLIQDDLTRLKNELGNPLLETRRIQEKEKEHLERKLSGKRDKLCELSTTITAIQKLLELEEKKKEFDRIPQSYIVNTVAFTEVVASDVTLNVELKVQSSNEASNDKTTTVEATKNGLTLLTEKIRAKVNIIESLLPKAFEGRGRSIYEKMIELHERAELVAVSIEDVTRKHDGEYCIWQQRMRDRKATLSQKHGIFIEETLLELSANDIYTELRNIYEDMSQDKKGIHKEIKNYKEQLEGIGVGIKAFNKQHIKRLEYEQTKKELCGHIAEIGKSLRETLPADFEVLANIIDRLGTSILQKDNMTKNLLTVIGKQDGPILGLGTTKTQTKRELMRSISQYTIAKNYADLKDKLDKRLQPQAEYDELCSLLAQMFQLKTNIKLLEAKEQINTLVVQYKLGATCKYEVTDGGANGWNKSLSDIKEKLREKFARDQYILGSYRSRCLSDCDLETYVREKCATHENLNRRLENVSKYEAEISKSNDEYKNSIEEYERAKNDYDAWKRDQTYHPLLSKFAKAYDRFLDVELNLKDLFNKESNTVQHLLLRKSNMVGERTQPAWDERSLGSKVGRSMNELCVFSQQYYERYALSGSEGKEGSNSGAFLFRIKGNEGNSAHIGVITREPGKGGEHACVLEGVYLNEHILHTFSSNALTLGIVTGLAIFTSPVVLLPYLAVASIALVFGSHWVDGPYMIIPNPAKDGSKVEPESTKLDQMELSFNDFIQNDIPAAIIDIISSEIENASVEEGGHDSSN